MNGEQTFQQFLTSQSVQIDVPSFAMNLLLAAALGFLLSRAYERFGDSLSNRRLFARNFVLLAVTTMLIISIVKSSLALSLGLVGALSIVRFRAAIKEPEELAFLFLTIAIGLGLGADQRLITLVAFALIMGLLWLRSLGSKASDTQNLYLSVDSHNPDKISLDSVVDILQRHCSNVDIKRFDQTLEALEASFMVEFDEFGRLEAAKNELLDANPDVKVSFLDLKGVNP